MKDQSQHHHESRSHRRRKYDLVNFTKMHGLGNDFMVVEDLTQKVKLNPTLIRAWADRHTGVGFDQLLLLSAPVRADFDFTYSIFNADGSEAGQCGNGTRAIARFIADQKLSVKNENIIATSTNTMKVRILDSGLAQVDMDTPQFYPQQIPFIPSNAIQGSYNSRYSTHLCPYTLTLANTTFEFYPISVGNPHAVLFIDDDAKTNGAFALQLQHSAYFPEGVNVGFAKILGENLISLRVFERGAGETKACGSGATAAAIAAIESGKVVGPEVKIQMAGGELSIYWDGQLLQMTGPAIRVYTGRMLVKHQDLEKN